MDRKIVSIWIANTGWESSVLRDVISSKHSENGDFLGSEFSKAFSLNLVDDDAIESDKTEKTYSLIEAIEGYSYDINIIV